MTSLPPWVRRAAPLAALPALLACNDTGLYRVNLGEVAVVTGDFDSVENLLLSLEVPFARVDAYHAHGPVYDLVEEYDWATLSPEVEDVMADDVDLGGYDVVFLDCGMRGAGTYVYNDAGTRDDQLVSDDRVIANLREYVEFGGQVYASDWAYDLIERAFPDQIDFLGDDEELDAAQAGMLSTGFPARVVDPDLREALELPEGTDELNLVFNNSNWAVMLSTQAEVLIAGDVRYRDYASGGEVEVRDAPLLVTFEYGDRGGKVVYTSFHSEAQTTDDVQRIVEYLVLLFQREGV